MKFQVDRRGWLRGEGNVQSQLLRPSDNKKCCVGFYCLAEGFTEEQISAEPVYGGLPGRYYSNDPFSTIPGVPNHDMRFYSIYNLNDDRNLTDEQRESLLKREFQKLGAEVEFIN